jgi:hypothetical protein
LEGGYLINAGPEGARKGKEKQLKIQNSKFKLQNANY